VKTEFRDCPLLEQYLTAPIIIVPARVKVSPCVAVHLGSTVQNISGASLLALLFRMVAIYNLLTSTTSEICGPSKRSSV